MKGSSRAMLLGQAVVLAVLLASPVRGAEPVDKTRPAELLDRAAPTSVAELQLIQKRIKEVLKKVVKATVGVRIGGAAGSGVIIDAEGHVLTAGHVSGNPGQACVLILPDGTEVKGKTLGRNAEIDSGLIQITTKGKWNFVPMGDSSKIKRGQWCIAVGHPGGYKPGRSPVVRLGRIVRSTRGFLQSDCTLVGGDSGGPLFDMDGKVIGIHSRIGPEITDNLHVPVNTYRNTWDRLVKAETLEGPERSPAFIGVRFPRKSNSLEVAEVYEDTPASRAGIKVGDTIVSINGHKLDDRNALMDFMLTKKPGDEVTLVVERDLKMLSFKVTLGKRPAD